MNTPVGASGIFTNPDTVIEAARKLREAGYSRFDFHTPYPLHGLDDAMGVKPTILPKIALAGGLVGMAAALFLQWWTGAVDYRLVIGGKPLFAFEPSIPITFELTVLLSAIATTVGMFALNGLPSWFSRWQRDAHFTRMMDDAFVVTVESGDPKFHPEKTASFLQTIGAEHVRIVEHHES